MGMLSQVIDLHKEQETAEKRDRDMIDALNRRVADIAQSEQALTGSIQNLVARADQQRSDDKKLRKDVADLARAIQNHAKQTSDALKGVTEAVAASLDELDKRIQGLPKQFPVPKDVVFPDRAEQFAEVREAIAGIEFPETDFSMLVDMLKMIAAKLDEPLVVEEISEPKKEFKITIAERDFQGRAKEIKAEEV